MACSKQVLCILRQSMACSIEAWYRSEELSNLALCNLTLGEVCNNKALYTPNL